VRWLKLPSRCSPRDGRAYARTGCSRTSCRCSPKPSSRCSPSPPSRSSSRGAPASSSAIHPSSKGTLRAENACCKSMFQVFQMFHVDVASVSCGCCKSRAGCRICCNGCTRMLQAFVLNVSVVFPDVSCKCVYLVITYVSHICCKCFYLDVVYVLHGFQMFVRCFCKCFKCILQMFHLPLDVYCKLLHSYVSKEDRVLHLPPRFSKYSIYCFHILFGYLCT
jgi:hypothetical protein